MGRFPAFLLLLGLWGQFLVAHADLIPYHIYLSLTGDSDSMQITFTTSSLPKAPLTQYWNTDEGPKTAVFVYGGPNNTLTFPNPSSTAIDYITSFTFTNLTRATYYSYQVCGDINNQTETCSATFSFRSLPEDDAEINIGFYGDLGSNATALMNKGPGGLYQYAASRVADFIVHNGDLAYNLASDGGVNGNTFMSRIEPITSITPYVVTPGNHEFYDNMEDPLYYSNWFFGQTQIGHRSNSTNPTMWYSFDIGSKLHIVAMSTEVYCADSQNLPNLYAWLENDLASVREREQQPWVVVFGHRQMYLGPISSHSSKLMRLGIQCTDHTLSKCDVDTPCDSGLFCAYSLEQLLEKYHADIFISGHVHTYARMLPIASNFSYEPQDSKRYVNAQHPTYLISGAPGIQAEYKRDTTDYPHYNLVKQVPGYSYSHMQVFNATHMYIKQIDVESADIVDDFWIVKDPTSPPFGTLESYLLLPTPELVCD